MNTLLENHCNSLDGGVTNDGFHDCRSWSWAWTKIYFKLLKLPFDNDKVSSSNYNTSNAPSYEENKNHFLSVNLIIRRVTVNIMWTNCRFITKKDYYLIIKKKIWKCFCSFRYWQILTLVLNNISGRGNSCL